MTSKVSFTIRRPPSPSNTHPYHATSPSRSSSQLASFVRQQNDSSDDEVDENATEFVTGFDKYGAQRLREPAKPSGPLVIAPLADRDWRVIVRARKQHLFIPEGTAAPIGEDGSQGGLGTRDTINSGPQQAGLVARREVETVQAGDVVETEGAEMVARVETLEESEDERARKALLASVNGNEEEVGATTIGTIAVGGNQFTRLKMDETDAYKQDVVTRPDSATLADYERVPVSQFGAALMRGMGWKEGAAASRTRRGPVEPWLPASRPALLGIGAKERPAEDASAFGKGVRADRRPDKRYIPLVKLEKEVSSHPPTSRSQSRSRSPSRSAMASRVGSKTSSPYPSDNDGRIQRHSRNQDLDNLPPEKSKRDRHGRRVRDRNTDYSEDHRRERSDGSRGVEHGRDREERKGGAQTFRRNERESSLRDRDSRY